MPSFDLTKPHLAYYSVPAAFLLVLLPSYYARISAGKNYDPAYPRKTAENSAKDTSLDKQGQTVLRIQRAEAAMANGFETLGMYAGGVAAAAAAGVPAETLGCLSAGYLACRLLYNAAYVFQDKRRLVLLRGAAWGTSMGVIIALWVKAGNRAVV